MNKKFENLKLILVAVIITQLVMANMAWSVPKKVAATGPSIRVKDLAKIQGNNDNQLVGYGIVTGLKGTGDRTTTVSNVMIQNMFENLGMKVEADDMRKFKSKNSAVVMITADLPASFRSGDSIDVTVSSMGDAKSLEHGVLLFSTLRGPDGKVYGSAQGPLMIGNAGNQRRRKSESLVGTIPGGGLISHNMDAVLVRGGIMTWVLRYPDFNTAARVARAINRHYPAPVAQTRGDRFVDVDVDLMDCDPTTLAAEIGELRVQPDMRARVVVNERTGTVVMGTDVKILPVSISHGDLSLTVTEEPEVNPNQPPGEEGAAPPPPRTRTERMVQLGGDSTVRDVIKIMNSIGATPKDIITILEALKNAGVLQGELEII